MFGGAVRAPPFTLQLLALGTGKTLADQQLALLRIPNQSGIKS
nr:hypothetical protein [Tanacetum cinerariifolium]